MSGNGSNSPYDYWIYRPKGFYDGWRHVPFPTLYDALPTAVTSDTLEIGLIFAAVIVAFSFIVIIPGFRKSERLSACIRIAVGLLVLASTLLCNFGQEWEVAHLKTKTQYRAGLRGDINASIGVKIGLRSVNITLKGEPAVKQMLEHGRVNETVDYNERLSWDNEGWTVGRAGFGPNAGKFNREFREHQRRGSPYPILWIAEYFTIDGEGIRWGRHYLQAGYFTHIMLWTAFALWILTLILFNMVILYGAIYSVATGVVMLVGNIIYATFRNPNQLKIPFEDGDLEFHWGWCFWLCLVTGVFCILIGILVAVLERLMSDKLNDFFNMDVLQGADEIYLDSSETSAMAGARGGVTAPFNAPGETSSGRNRYDLQEVEMQQPRAAHPERTFRKRSMLGTKQIRHVYRPIPPPKETSEAAATKEEDEEDYENTPTTSQKHT